MGGRKIASGIPGLFEFAAGVAEESGAASEVDVTGEIGYGVEVRRGQQGFECGGGWLEGRDGHAGGLGGSRRLRSLC